MAKRIQYIGYIEFDDGRKVDIVNARSLGEYNSFQIVAADGMYLYREWGYLDERYLNYTSKSFTTVIRVNNLYKVEFIPNKSADSPMLIRQPSFKQFVLFADKKGEKK